LLTQQQLQLEKLKREQQQIHSQLAAQRQTRQSFSHADHVNAKEEAGAENERHEQAGAREIQVESDSDGSQSERGDVTSRNQDVDDEEVESSQADEVRLN
jgi:hypothetical protein